MKRFLLFGFYSYYPAGGSGDVIGDFETLEQAREASTRRDHYHVLDLERREWVDLPTGWPEVK